MAKSRSIPGEDDIVPLYPADTTAAAPASPYSVYPSTAPAVTNPYAIPIAPVDTSSYALPGLSDLSSTIANLQVPVAAPVVAAPVPQPIPAPAPVALPPAPVALPPAPVALPPAPEPVTPAADIGILNSPSFSVPVPQPIPAPAPVVAAPDISSLNTPAPVALPPAPVALPPAPEPVTPAADIGILNSPSFSVPVPQPVPAPAPVVAAPDISSLNTPAPVASTQAPEPAITAPAIDLSQPAPVAPPVTSSTPDISAMATTPNDIYSSIPAASVGLPAAAPALDPSSYMLPGLSGINDALANLQAQLAVSPMTPASPSTQLSYFSPSLNKSIPFSVQDANQYKLTDQSGNTLFSGTGSDAKAKLSDILSGLSSKYGDQASWVLSEGTPSYTTPGGTDWTNIAQQTPVLHDTFNPLVAAALGFGLPLAAGLAAPALLGAGAAGAGGGAAGAGALDALAAAPLSGAAGAAGAADLAASIAPTLGAAGAGLGATGLGALATAPLSGAAGAAGAADLASAIVPTLGDIAAAAPVAAAAPSVADTLATAPLSGAAGTAGAADLASTIAPSLADVAAPAATGLDALATAPLSGSAGTAGAADLASTIAPSLGDVAAVAPAAAAVPETVAPADLVVTAPSTAAAAAPVAASPLAIAGAAALPAIAAALPAPAPAPAAPDTVAPQDIVVNAPAPVVAAPPATPPAIAATAPIDVSSTLAATQALADATTTPSITKPTSPLSTATSALGNLSKVLQAGAALSTLAGVLSGKNTSGTVGTIPAGLLGDMSLPSIFSSALPAAQSMYTGSTGAGGSPRDVLVPFATSMQNAPTMTNIPTVDSVQAALARGATGGIAATNPLAVIPAPAQPVKKAHGGMAVYAEGGEPSTSSYAVNGPGTGRSDSIPAKLSDGEYVMDAETVALLGDGSSKAGADALDRMRVNLRKQKGKNLAQGKFSVKAKAPEAYMTGGRL